MTATVLLDLKQLLDTPPAGMTLLVCSPATFDYYIAAMERLGIRKEENTNLEQKKRELPEAVEVRTVDRFPLGVIAAYDRNHKPLCAYRVPFDQEIADARNQKPGN